MTPLFRSKSPVSIQEIGVEGLKAGLKDAKIFNAWLSQIAVLNSKIKGENIQKDSENIALIGAIATKLALTNTDESLDQNQLNNLKILVATLNVALVNASALCANMNSYKHLKIKQSPKIKPDINSANPRAQLEHTIAEKHVYVGVLYEAIMTRLKIHDLKKLGAIVSDEEKSRSESTTSTTSTSTRFGT